MIYWPRLVITPGYHTIFYMRSKCGVDFTIIYSERNYNSSMIVYLTMIVYFTILYPGHKRYKRGYKRFRLFIIETTRKNGTNHILK